MTSTTLRRILLDFQVQGEPGAALDVLDWQDEGLTEDEIVQTLFNQAFAIADEKPELYNTVKAKVQEYWKENHAS